MKTASMENTKDAPVKPRERAAGGPLEWWGRGRSFLTEVRAEMRRVTWPTRAEVIATTWVVVLFSVVMGTYLWSESSRSIRREPERMSSRPVSRKEFSVFLCARELECVGRRSEVEQHATSWVFETYPFCRPSQ